MSFNTQDQGQEQGDQPTFKVGEREYDIQSAATKIENADSHISKIEAENAEFRTKLASLEAQLEQSTKLDQALESFKAQKSNAENVQPSENTTGLSEEQITAITQNKMEEYLAAQQAQQQQEAAKKLAEDTYRSTAETLVGIYGEGVDEAVQKKASELGVPATELYAMANNPASAKLLLETMTPKGGSTQVGPSGGYNTSNFYGDQDESLIKGVDTSNVTSSTILDVLSKAGAKY